MSCCCLVLDGQSWTAAEGRCGEADTDSSGQGEYPPTVALLPTPLFELFLLNVKSFGWFIVEPLSPLDAMPVILHL